MNGDGEGRYTDGEMRMGMGIGRGMETGMERIGLKIYFLFVDPRTAFLVIASGF